MATSLTDEQGNPKYTNRLEAETSPYLKQHAHNPVDWYPWGDEAFERARREDKPVFLSIGYSTCHWCHVMEAESFDNEEIADYLNRHFISIKLDREERPDIDDVYMTGVQMLTGQGGWPMSSFLTPDGHPFFAGTYYPPENFQALLEQIVSVWGDRREEVVTQAREIADNISRFASARAEAKALPDDLAGLVSAEARKRFDATHGGFGSAPKFPNEVLIEALIDDWQRNRNPSALDALTRTLDGIARGGICDHVGGGFHRYAVDDRWLVPHFEKMLYNQAQLLAVFARAAALTGNSEWRRTARRIAQDVLRDMTDEQGAFFSATDADSEGEEGRFFVWTPAEIEIALGPEDASWMSQVFDVRETGNFEGRIVLEMTGAPMGIAERMGMPIGAFFSKLDALLEVLYEAREARIHPLRDDKVITAWNGMMIEALTVAGIELEDDALVDSAARAADSVWQRAFDGERLFRIVMGNARSIAGNLEDHAFLADALLTLYAATGERRHRLRAERLVERMVALFADEEGGGFYLSLPEDEGPMITRPKSPMDGAQASANSIALSALVKLWRLSDDVSLEAQITSSIKAFAGLIMTSPASFPRLVMAIEEYRRGQTAPVQFAGGGVVRARLRRVNKGVRLELMIDSGWHINAAEVDDASLIPTRVDAPGGTINYPAAGEGVWHGEVSIDVQGGIDSVRLTVQPCSGKLCLAPQELVFPVS